MKKFIMSVPLAAAVLAGCQKMPSNVDADGEFLVSTSYDQEVDFSKYNTFTVADSIFVLDSYMGGDMVKNSFTDGLIDEYKDMMEACGYKYVQPPVDGGTTDADLGIQLTYVSDTDYYVDYVDPYWWLDYPGYWSSSYWGLWGGGWYYPYPVMYEFSTHSLMADMADLTAPEGENEDLTVVWSCMINGNVGATRSDFVRFKTAIQQAFKQSPYLEKDAE